MFTHADIYRRQSFVLGPGIVCTKADVTVYRAVGVGKLWFCTIKSRYFYPLGDFRDGSQSVYGLGMTEDQAEPF